MSAVYMHSGELPIVDQLREAPDNAARASILLKVPDAIVWQYCARLLAPCLEAGFRLGVSYILQRQCAGFAVRTPAGHLPDELQGQLETYRAAMFRVSRGGKP